MCGCAKMRAKAEITLIFHCIAAPGKLHTPSGVCGVQAVDCCRHSFVQDERERMTVDLRDFNSVVGGHATYFRAGQVG